MPSIKDPKDQAVLNEAECELPEAVQETQLPELREVCVRPEGTTFGVGGSVNLITVNLLDDLQCILTDRKGDLTTNVVTTIVTRLLSHNDTLCANEEGLDLYLAVQKLDEALRAFEKAAEKIVDLTPGEEFVRYVEPVAQAA